MNIDENVRNKVKITGEKKGGNIRDLLIKSCHIFAVMYPRPMNMVPNFSLGSDLVSGVSHMQVI